MLLLFLMRPSLQIMPLMHIFQSQHWYVNEFHFKERHSDETPRVFEIFPPLSPLRTIFGTHKETITHNMQSNGLEMIRIR